MERLAPARPQAPSFRVRRLRGGRWSAVDDCVAAEEPLQLRLDGEPLSIVMRTPGCDLELTLGLLYAERVLTDLGQVELIRISAENGREREEAGPAAAIRVQPDLLPSNTVDVVRRHPGRRPPRRSFTTTSACGVCGAVTIDELAAAWPELPPGPPVAFSLLGSLPDRLRRDQRLFERTGGLHAAGLFDRSGRLVLAREDVGRHNAVDKVVGRLLLQGRLPARERVLAVSGRAGFEIVQKAVAAGVEIVVAVGAPSSLAVATAQRFGLTLVGFAKPGAGNVYSGWQRILDS